MITNFNFPRVTVNQLFSPLSSAATSVLPVCIIGPQYRVYDYDTYGKSLPTAALTNGALATLVGEIPETVTLVTLYMPLAYAKLPTTTTDAVAVTVDAQNYTLSLATGSFTGAARIFSDDLRAGDIILLAVSQVSGTSKFTVMAVLGDNNNQILVHPVTSSDTLNLLATTTIQAGYRIVTTRIKGTCSLGTIEVAEAAYGILLEAVIGGTVSATVTNCATIYFEYREPVTDYVRRLGIVAAGLSTLLACKDIFGNCSTENPLGLAVLMAAKAAGSSFVYFIGVDPSENLLLAYALAMDFLGKDDTVYSIVPCTYTDNVITKLLSLVNLQSLLLIPNYKILWYGAETPNNATTNTELVLGVIAQKITADRRATMVYADDVLFNGLIVPNWAVAAAAAGMRSKELPHRPLSNLQYTFFSVKLTHGLTASQLRVLGANGIWLIANNAQGIAINKRQLTTAAADDVNYDLQSLTTNIDSICKALKSIGTDMVGNSNISPGLLSLLSILCNTLMASFTTTKLSALVGPQLLSTLLVLLAQDPVVLDRVYAHIKGQPPKPFNQFDITFTMV